MTCTRTTLIDHVARRIAGLPGRRIVVAIDGVDGAGKTRFAGDLAAAVRAFGRPVVQATIDGFHHPRAIRYRRGRHSPDGYYLDSYDYAGLRRHLLAPFRAGAISVETARFDHRTDRAVSIRAAMPDGDAALLIDGIFLHRDELAWAWDLSLFLQVPFAVSYARMAVRDGAPADPHAMENRRYLEGQQLYLRTCRPEQRATLLIDNAELTAPRLLRDGPA